MADPKMVITFGADEFDMSDVSMQEMSQVKKWIGCRNRRDWFTLIGDEDPDAMIAALTIARRKNGEQVEFADADFGIGEVSAKFVDETGREVEPVLTVADDGTVVTGPDGLPIPVTDRQGKQQWRDVTTGDVIPFGISA